MTLGTKYSASSTAGAMAWNTRWRSGVRHGRNACGIDRLHGRDQIEYGIQPGLCDIGLGIADFDAGEAGNAFDVVRT